MKYKLDKEILKKIIESGNETIELEIIDNNIELVEDKKEWEIGDHYFYIAWHNNKRSYEINEEIINNENDKAYVCFYKCIMFFHTMAEAQEYREWLEIRNIVEETINELGRPTSEDVEDARTPLLFIYYVKGDLYEDSCIDEGYEQPFLCKKIFKNELIKKLGKEKTIFFYKNLWRFL